MYALLFHLCFNILTPLIYYIIMLVKVIGSIPFLIDSILSEKHFS